MRLLVSPAHRRGSAALVFLIGVKLIDIRGMREIFRLRRDEFYVALLTLMCGFLGATITNS